MPAIEHSATLTSTPESAPRYLGMLEVASQNLENLQTDTDPNEQLRAAVKLTFAAELLPVVAKTEDQQQTVTELFSDLVMFAANPDASSSLLVRSEALEAGLQILAHNQSREGAAYIPELEVYRKRFETLIPTYFTNSVVDETTYSTVHPGPYRNQVGWMTNDFLRHENLDKATIFSDPYQDGGDPDTHIDRLPVGAFLLGDTIIQRQTPSFGYVGPESTRYLVANALGKVGRILEHDLSTEDLRKEFAPSKPLRPLLVAARIARFNRHGDYTRSLNQLMDDVSEKHHDYPEMMDALYEEVGTLKEAFPAVMAPAVQEGARILTADTTYALVGHAMNGWHTSATVQLNSGSELSVKLSENEPRELLNSLGRSSELIHDALTNETVRSVLSVDGDGFRIWRLIDLAHTLPPAVAVHLRAYGSENYDEQYEYGRPGEGVEATMGFIVDPTLTDPGDSPIRLGKKAYKKDEVDNRISIRIDREGIRPYEKYNLPETKRNPTQKYGTASLDLGSVLGPETSLGTRVGRFLAWGNKLRSEKDGTLGLLNHVSHTFDEQLGEADHFAVAVHSLDERLQGMRATKSEFQAYAKRHIGKLAVSVDQESVKDAA